MELEGGEMGDTLVLLATSVTGVISIKAEETIWEKSKSGTGFGEADWNDSMLSETAAFSACSPLSPGQ
ncbi:hypothetical protein LOZ58_002859 [Ophidiomyces ophidiicola]|nr:hypothetical protein LOZ65_001678 [Ophidiomyces ophidiicola]KAI1962517.1 hypothetical protein LOZ58_002859 [Ophidiomyces ophidiicola]